MKKYKKEKYLIIIYFLLLFLNGFLTNKLWVLAEIYHVDTFVSNIFCILFLICYISCGLFIVLISATMASIVVKDLCNEK